MSDVITRPFASGRGLPDKRTLANTIRRTLFKAGVWTHDENGECEIDEFALADAVLKLYVTFFSSQTISYKCPCRGTLVRWYDDKWYVTGDCYHSVDGWIICIGCNWRLRAEPRIIWEGYKAKGQG